MKVSQLYCHRSSPALYLLLWSLLTLVSSQMDPTKSIWSTPSALTMSFTCLYFDRLCDLVRTRAKSTSPAIKQVNTDKTSRREDESAVGGAAAAVSPPASSPPASSPLSRTPVKGERESLLWFVSAAGKKSECVPLSCGLPVLPCVNMFVCYQWRVNWLLASLSY